MNTGQSTCKWKKTSCNWDILLRVNAENKLERSNEKTLKQKEKVKEQNERSNENVKTKEKQDDWFL